MNQIGKLMQAGAISAKAVFLWIAIFAGIAQQLCGQRVFEKDDHVFIEDEHEQRDLGRGWSPIVLSSDKIAFVRGGPRGYGAKFDCTQTESKDRIVSYDLALKEEKVLFDRAITFDNSEMCTFDGIAMSPDESTLYIVSPRYEDSGSMAIVQLKSTEIKIVPRINAVYVIENGFHRGELIYIKRMFIMVKRNENPHTFYPLILANADGTEHRILKAEPLTSTDSARQAPYLKKVLDELGGQIRINGRLFP